MARKVCQAGPQQVSNSVTDTVASEVELLNGRKAGKVVHKRLGTLITDSVVAEVELLNRRKEGQVGT